MTTKVLILATSHTEFSDSGRKTGVWAEEVILPFFMMADAGMTVDICTPKGGQVPFDPASMKAEGENSADIERFIQDPHAQELFANASIASEVDASEYDGVFVPGGHGAMWDLPNNEGARNIIEHAFSIGTPIAAVCHGPAVLVRSRRPDGRPIVEGRHVNSFTDAEEIAAGHQNAVPFLLESRLKQLNANFSSTQNWQSCCVVDGNLITGQNPASTKKVATAFLRCVTESKAKAA